MATIGLDQLFYSKITEGEDGQETYAKPERLAKAIKAELSVELAEAVLYADDGAAEIVKEFKSGTLKLGVNDIGLAAAEALTGAKADKNGVLVSTTEDSGLNVAIGFRAKKSNGMYRYYWLYRVRFGVPSTNLETKGESITFQTPEIEGTVGQRIKPDTLGRHPWKAEADGDNESAKEIVKTWFNNVYEPDYTAVVGG